MKPEAIKAMFRYDADTGSLVWAAPRGRVRVGAIAGTVGVRGYVVVGVRPKKHLAHRLIWAMHFGEIPAGFEIDHIDGDKTNNRLSNLRLVTHSGNQRNAKLPRNNTSGHIGVSFHKASGRLRAKAAGHDLGLFDDTGSAVAALRQYAAQHGFHPNHGRRV